MVTSITPPKPKTSIGTWTGIAGWTIFMRTSIDGLFRVCHPTRFVAAARGCSIRHAVSAREGGSEARGSYHPWSFRHEREHTDNRAAQYQQSWVDFVLEQDQ
jgi:hypothetical protein